MFKTHGRGTARKPGTMNRLESEYAAVLTARLHAGEVAWFRYESMTFKIGPDCRYTPDFAVMLADGTIELHETKGFMQEDALVKIKACVELFPFPLVLVTKATKKEGGALQYRRIA
jgi:hypothetical protein